MYPAMPILHSVQDLGPEYPIQTKQMRSHGRRRYEYKPKHADPGVAPV